MNDKLLALRLFMRVARMGSFSAAARELDLSQPSVSRIIAALERDVGGALITRTTRALTLTEHSNQRAAGEFGAAAPQSRSCDAYSRHGGSYRRFIDRNSQSSVVGPAGTHARRHRSCCSVLGLG